MKPKKFFSCICVLAVCVSVLFVSACGPHLYPIAEGTYLWENVLKIQEMPFPQIKVKMMEIDKEAFDEAEWVNVGCADLAPQGPTEQGPAVQSIAQELTYFSFELYVFDREDNVYIQINVANFREHEGTTFYRFDALDPLNGYNIAFVDLSSEFNYFTRSKCLRVEIVFKNINEHKDEDPSWDYGYRNDSYTLAQNADSPTDGIYLWETVWDFQFMTFPNVKLVLTEIDKETFEQAEGVNVFLDESPSATRKYYSFELYAFVKEVNDFVLIDIVGFDWQNGSTFYDCKTVDPSKSYGIADIRLEVHSKSYSTSDYYISLTIVSDGISDTTEDPSREYFHDSYLLRCIKNEGENL